MPDPKEDCMEEEIQKLKCEVMKLRKTVEEMNTYLVATKLEKQSAIEVIAAIGHIITSYQKENEK